MKDKGGLKHIIINAQRLINASDPKSTQFQIGINHNFVVI